MNFSAQSDAQTICNVPSKLIYSVWCSKVAYAGADALFEVRTSLVGDGANVQVRAKIQSGQTLGTLPFQIYGNRLYAGFPIPVNVPIDELIYLEVRLPQHNLQGATNLIPTRAPINISSMSWSAPEARRGDVLTLTVNFQSAIANDTEALIIIYEFDQNGHHDPICKIPTTVQNRRIQVLWEYEYHDDTGEIPTQQEMQRYGQNYSHPEYFFVVDIDGVRFGDRQESGLLRFMDWVDVKVTSGLTKPLEGANYTIYFADATTQAGVVDSSGLVRIENVGPGDVYIEFSDFTDIYQIDEKFSMEQINKNGNEMNLIDDNEMLPLASKFSITGGKLHLAVLCTARIFVIDPNCDAPIKESTVYTIETADGIILHAGSVGCHGIIQWTGLPIGRNILKIADHSFEFESQVGDHGFITVEF